MKWLIVLLIFGVVISALILMIANTIMGIMEDKKAEKQKDEKKNDKKKKKK